MQLKQQSEPCVRITVTIPKDAAQRLRQLAAEGSSTLRTLGILGVHLEDDSVISIKPPGQDVNVNTADNVPGSAGTVRPTSHVADAGRLEDLSQLLGNGASAGNSNTFYQQHLRVAASNEVIQQQQQQQQKQQELLQHQRRNILLGGPSTSSAAQQALLQLQQQGMTRYNAVASTPQVFKSPNTICPMEGKVPLPPQVLNPATGAVPTNARDFPFESMRQARVLQGRVQDGTVSLNTNMANGPTTASGVVSIQPSLAASLTSSVHGKGTQAHQLGQTSQAQLSSGGVGAPPNVALRVVKNPQSGEIVTTIAAGSTATLGGKSQFLQPPPPPYPGVGVGINTTHNAAAGTVQNQQVVNKPMHQSQQYLPANANSGATAASNNIAMTSPLLVNLLQNDGNSSSSIGNQSSQQIKPLTPSQTLLHQQQSPLASMSPSAQQQQHLVNSPMREYLLQQPQPTTPAADASNLGAIGVPSSPTTAGVNVNPARNMQPQQQLPQSQVQQQILLSPNNMYNQQPPRFHQQQVTPQQVALMRHQQMHRQQQMQQQASGGASPQRFIQQQQQIVSPVLNQMRQIRPTMSLQHQQHQQPFMSSGGMSPVAHSPASSHHSSLHSPLAMPTPQQLLSPSSTPIQSPHHHTHPHTMLAQQPLQAQQILTAPMSSQVPPANNAILPPPPDYNQAAASAHWPALNKPMDSATKSSFQEFTRYQMQYNLQQQQINNNQQQNLQQPAQQQPLLSASSQERPSTISNANTCNPSNTDATSLGEANDALMALSDLDGLNPNDLDALLPSLSCDLDSTLSLEDKNELESLLQDAKDLDLDLIEENLSAVGMDIGDAATATSLIEDDITVPNSVLQTGIEQNLNLSLMQPQQSLMNCNNTNSMSNMNLQQQQQQQQQQQLYLQQQMSQASQLPVPNQLHLIPNSSFVQQQQQQQQQQQSQLLTNNNSSTSNFMRSASAASTSSTASATTTQKQLIINPLTGELEPMPSDDSETEAEQETQHLIRPPTVVASSRVAPASMVSSGSFVPTASEALPNILFSAEEDSNSCSTAISKMSEQNNGLIGTSGAGSDTDRSRDSFISSKSAGRSRKGAGKMNQQQQLCNKLGSVDGVSSSMTPPASNNSPLIAGGVTVGVTPAGNTNRKSKPNLLREKLQQSVRERKKENTTAKPKRERNKAGGKTKAIATVASGIGGNIPPITTVASIAETSATNEKIKLRLKIEKSEPVSPAYKVDVTFVPSPSPKTTIGEVVTSIGPTLDNHSVLSSTAPTTAMTTAGGATANLSASSVLQSQLNAQMLAASAMQQHQHQQHQGQQVSVQTFNNFNLPSTVTVTATSTSTTSPLNTATSGASGVSSAVDEPKVPPLHISLRGGKSSIVIKNSRKDRKKSQATSIPGDVDEDSKSKQLKRSFSVANTTASSVNPVTKLCSGVTEDVTGAPDVKQSKLQQSGAIITQYNGTLESGIKTNSIVESLNSSHFVNTAQIASNVAVSKTTALLANKNGLTISALSAIHASDLDNKSASSSGTTIATPSVVTAASLPTSIAISATPIKSFPHLLKQQHQQHQQHQQQSQQSPQIIKTTALPSSITLSTVSCSSGGVNPSSSSVAQRVIANLKSTLKTSSATITPIGAGATSVGGFSAGKPLTKSHKPPSYMAAVQQLQLQKQQQQQMAALAEKQTQQQMLAAAAQILPSATTLKRVEINTLTNKIESHEVITPSSVSTILTTVKTQSEAAEQNQNASGSKAEICDKNKQSILTAISTPMSTLTPAATVSLTATSVTAAKTSTTTSTLTTATLITQNSVSANKDSSISITEKNTGKASPSTPIVVATTSAAIPSPPPVSSAAIVTSPILRNSPASSNGSSHLGQGNNNNNGSTGGGEDSGIESMDALSEKSPHQQASSSPAQQLQVITPPALPAQASDAGSSACNNRNSATSINDKQDVVQPKSTACTTTHPEQPPILVGDDEIEKALAKMEGLHDDNCPTATISLSPGKLPSSELKINGEHFPNSSALTPILDDGDNDDLIKNLTQVVEISNAKSTSVNKVEHKNQEGATTTVDKDFKEIIIIKKEEGITEEKSFLKDSFSQQIKEENAKRHIGSTSMITSVLTAEKHEKVEVIKLEISDEVTKDKEPCKMYPQTSSISKDGTKDLNKSQQDVLPPISIDIPVNTDSETRIRTRASSRLESPLEQVKTDMSPLSELPSCTSVEVGITASAAAAAAAVNKNLNPRSLSPQPNALPNNGHTSLANTNNNVMASGPNKDTKRKRPDGDSLDPLDTKRMRPVSATVANTQMTSNVPKKLVPAEVNLAIVTTSPNANASFSVSKSTVNADLPKASTMAIDPMPDKPFKKIEESSDSDEPLIEVAEKVRNSKTTPNLIVNTGTTNNELESNVALTSPTGMTPKPAISKEVIEGKDNAMTPSSTNLNAKTNTPATVVEKTTRNSSRAQHQQTQKSVVATATSTATTVATSFSQSIPITTNATTSTVISIGPKNVKHSSAICSNVSQANTSTITTASTTATTTAATAIAVPTTTTQNSINSNTILSGSNVANSIASQISAIVTATATATTTTTVHATRGVTHSAAANTATTAAGTNNNNNSSPVDEKIGTRRSVRASAAANKIIYSRTNAAMAVHSAEGKASPAAKGGHTTESGGEARRKTRSAGIGEAQLTEGRRRRGSRDFK